MIFNLNFIWNSMCKGNSCFNIFQNLTGGSIFCPKTQTPSLWGWENAEFEKVSFAKSAKAFDLTLHSHWLTPTTLFKKEWKMQKIVLFKVNFLDDFSHNDFYFFSNIILFISVGHFFRRVIISKNQGDLLENTNWSFLVRSLGWKQFFISFFVCRNHFCIICYLLWYAMCYALYIARAQYKRCPVELSVSHSPHGTPA